MGIRVVDGRDVADSDTPEARPVVLVNETFARQHWPGEPAVGRRIRLGGAAGDWFTVVGVVSDIRHLGPATPPRPEFYQPYTQRSFPFMAFVVRTSGSPTALVPSIRAAVTNLDRAQPISGVSTMEEHIARALSRPRFMSTLIGCFGFLALVLSTVGVYGVMAFSVTQRTREIAIRTALGATGRDVLTLVVGKAIWLAAAGVAARRRDVAGTLGRAARAPLRRHGCRSGNLRRRDGTAHRGRGTGCGASRMAGDENPGGDRPEGMKSRLRATSVACYVSIVSHVATCSCSSRSP